MGWNYLSIPKLQRLHRWSLGMDKKFRPILYWVCNYISMLGLKLNHVSKRGHWSVWHGIHEAMGGGLSFAQHYIVHNDLHRCPARWFYSLSCGNIPKRKNILLLSSFPSSNWSIKIRRVNIPWIITVILISRNKIYSAFNQCAYMAPIIVCIC